MMRAILAAVACLTLAIGTASGAIADWREDIRVFRVAFVAPRAPSAEVARMEPFRAYLQSRIGVTVELVPVASIEALIDAQLADRVQYGIHTAIGYAAASAACECLEPLGVASATDRSIGFYSVLLASADSGITALADAKGRILTLSAEDSVAGRLVPEAQLASEGIDITAHFAEVRTAAGPEEAVRDLIAGNTDVAAGWSSLSGDPIAGFSFGLLTRLVIDGTLAEHPLRVIWTSRLIPFGPHAVKRSLDPELKGLLVEALLDMSESAPEALDAVDRAGHGGGGFASVTDSDYAALAPLVGGH